MVSELVQSNNGPAVVISRYNDYKDFLRPEAMKHIIFVTDDNSNKTAASFKADLAGLAPSAPAGDLNTNKNFPTVTISVAGGQANGMTYIMDGGTHNDPFNNLNLPLPFPDAMQEFKVETNALPAQYGHHSAAAVNAVTVTSKRQRRCLPNPGARAGNDRNFLCNDGHDVMSGN